MVAIDPAAVDIWRREEALDGWTGLDTAGSGFGRDRESLAELHTGDGEDMALGSTSAVV